MKIIITGGTGFLGSQLARALIQSGHEVAVVTRQSPAALGPAPYRIIQWPLTAKDEVQFFTNCDAVINLAGESVAGARWTNERKNQIKSSRIKMTDEIVDLLRSSNQIKVFISSSAIGFYGHRKSEVLTEDSPAGEGFLAEVCKDWEKSAMQLKTPGLRTVLLRTGIVLDRGHGILSELESLNQNYAGGTVGDGQQFMSWIHVQDWVRSVQFCLDNEKMSGPINVVAPEAVSNKAFCEVYGKLFGKSLQMPAPSFALRLALGEMSSLALDSQNVRPQKLLDAHFKFQFPYLKEALENIYEYEKQGRKVYDFHKSETWIPRPIEQVFEFFSDAKNLERITPPTLSFKIVKVSTEKIQTGTLIDYNLKIHGVPVKWRTEIQDWSPPHQFVDTQLRGPYSRWHHTHSFSKLADGTFMQDKVHYELPLGILGRIGGLALVKRDVKNIFSYRQKVILDLFS